MRISRQTTNEIDHKVSKATMTGVFNLRDILELINDGFQDATLAEQQFVREQNQAVFILDLRRVTR